MVTNGSSQILLSLSNSNWHHATAKPARKAQEEIEKQV